MKKLAQRLLSLTETVKQSLKTPPRPEQIQARKVFAKRVLDNAIGLTVQDFAPQEHLPALTYALLITLPLVFILTRSNLESVAGVWGFSDYTKLDHHGFNFISPVFFHTGWLVLFGNLAYLFVFGVRVECALGTFNYALLLAFSNITAEYGHLLVVPNDTTIGANGCVAGLLVYYCLQFPRARVFYQVNYVVKLVFKKINKSVIEFPALVFVLIFFVMQIFGAMIQSTGLSDVDSWGHLGGLVGGFIFWILWRL